MKKSTLQLIAIIVTALLICLAGCKNSNQPIVKARDYQIELTNDSILIFDGDRYVGAAEWNDIPTPLDSVFLNDNL